ESDRPAVGGRGGLAVDGLRDEKGPGARPVDITAAALVVVLAAFARAEYAQYGGIELLRFLEVVGTDHYVIEHFVLLPFLARSCICDAAATWYSMAVAPFLLTGHLRERSPTRVTSISWMTRSRRTFRLSGVVHDSRTLFDGRFGALLAGHCARPTDRTANE